jgi:hypothetical protein
VFTLRILTMSLVLFATVCHADDCKPVSEALEKLNSTPVYVAMTRRWWDAQGQCTVSAGIFRQNVGARSYTPPESPAAPSMDICRHVGLETFKGEAVQHYYTATRPPDANRGISELWISVATGQIVKRFEIYQGSEFKWEYDYDSRKVDALF